MLAAALALLVAVASPFGAREAGPSRSEVLVQLTPAAACTEAATLVRAGAQAIAPELQLYRLSASRAGSVERRLRAAGALRSLSPERPAGRLTATRAADPLSTEEWWRAAIGVDGLTPPGPGRPVTIVDSGVDLAHPDFADRPNTIALNAQEPAPVGGRHGTAVASLVGASENGAGIVGIYPQAVIRSWDASLGDGRALPTGDIVAGIMAAARGGPGVINLSLGGPGRDDLIEQAVSEAWARGSLVVAAAGNDGDRGSRLSYPAALPHVLTVGATNRSNAVTSFSSASRYVDLAAPGEGVLVAGYPVGGWEPQSGTSFAAPLVAGAAAWVWSARPDLDNSQLFEVMRRSARDIGAPGRDAQSGFGLLNVAAALTWQAPARDPLEPNDDVEHVKPDGFFETGLRPLSAPGRERATIDARLDANEDPRDVYRIYLPARRDVVVAATGTPDVDISVWGPDTTAIGQGGGLRLGVSARRGNVAERVVVKASPRGRWAYVAVGPGRTVEASYRLTVTPRAASARR